MEPKNAVLQEGDSSKHLCVLRGSMSNSALNLGMDEA